MNSPALTIHEGCGVMAQLDLFDNEWARAELEKALRAGWVLAPTILEQAPSIAAPHSTDGTFRGWLAWVGGMCVAIHADIRSGLNLTSLRKGTSA